MEVLPALEVNRAPRWLSNLVVTVLACSGSEPSDSPTSPLPPPPAPARVPASVLVTPAVSSLDVGDTIRLSATVVDSDSRPISMAVAWASRDTAVASVSPAGLVTGKAVGGPISVVASVQTVSGSGSVTVRDSLTMMVDLSPSGFPGDSVVILSPAGERLVRTGETSAVPMAGTEVQPVMFLDRSDNVIGMTMVVWTGTRQEFLLPPGSEATLLTMLAGSLILSADRFAEWDKFLSVWRSASCYQGMLSRFTSALNGSNLFIVSRDTAAMNSIRRCATDAFAAQAAAIRGILPAASLFTGVRIWEESGPPHRVAFENYGARLIAVAKRDRSSQQIRFLARQQFRFFIPSHLLPGGMSNTIRGGIIDHVREGGTQSG